MTKIKIMWYNIERGFHKKESDGTLTFEPERLKKAIKIVRKENPNILFLGEADFGLNATFEGPKTSKIDYQKRFGFPFYFQFEITPRKGEAILSKLPFDAKSFSTEILSHLESKFEISGKKVEIFMFHPYPSIPEKEKAEKIKKMLEKIHAPCIFLGDFNALSKKDNYDIKDVAEGYRPFRGDKAEENAKESLQCLALQEVESNGLIDTYYATNKTQGYTYPTKGYWPSSDYKSMMRIDYIFCSKDIKILDSGIIKNKLVEEASDHYPIYAILEV
jgi:endonuclease/exonuclease/phosphatase family metal-dependent hydrolase